MTDETIRKNMERTAAELVKWADDTEHFLRETAAFFEEVKESGLEIPENIIDHCSDDEKIIQNVTDHLKEVKEAMVNIGYDEKDPVVYQVVTELDTPRNTNAGGASFEDFCQTVNNRLPDKEADEDLRKVFELFVDDPDSDTTSLESIKRVADELGENIEEEELNAMLNKASKAGARLTFEDFVAIMKEKI